MRNKGGHVRPGQVHTALPRNCEAKFVGDHSEVKPSRIHGLGLHAIRLITANERITTRETRGFRGYNHSCNPNVLLVDEGQDTFGLVLRDIQPGEELTVWYGPRISKQLGCRCPECKEGVEQPITFIPPFEYCKRVIVRDRGVPSELNHDHLWVIRQMKLGESAETTKITLVRESRIQELVHLPLTDPDARNDIRKMAFPELILNYELTGRRTALRF